MGLSTLNQCRHKGQDLNKTKPALLGGGAWAVILALGRMGEEDCRQSEASLGYNMSSRPAKL